MGAGEEGEVEKCDVEVEELFECSHKFLERIKVCAYVWYVMADQSGTCVGD